MQVSTSTASKDPKCLDSSVLSSTTVTDEGESIGDTETQISMDLEEVQSILTPSTSDIQETCFFCNRKQKYSGTQILSLIFPRGEQIVQQLKSIAETVNDCEILSKLERQNVVYHKPCYASYLTKHKRFTAEPAKSADSNWHNCRRLHKLAFESLSLLITREIIENEQVMYFAQLFLRYQSLLLEFGEQEIDFNDIEDYRSEMLEKKVLKTFGDCVSIEASTGLRKRKIIYKKDIEISILANNIKLLETQNEKKFEDVAYELRNYIKNIDRNPLPSRLTANDIIGGECEIPKKLFDFMQAVIAGPDICEKNCNITTVKIKSICSDIIYAVTKGRCKPAKNLTLGLAVKSLTNSRQVITILNRYGHTIGYNLAEELETEMTYTSIEDNKIIPTGITATDGRSTHVAFDNFDRFVDTTSGKDTMHDTVGIIYQFPGPEIGDSDDSLLEGTENEGEPLRKRRRFNEIVPEIQPYYSKPSACAKLLTEDSFTNTILLTNAATEIAIDKDLLWIMSLSRLESVPMWLGYNCLTSTDQSESQRIEYLPPINYSPTSYAVVNKTLSMANEIAEKCQQKQIIVTYDLAIAKMAMQIQEEVKPKFDHIFINLGAFHMQMAFFKAIGKYIDSCGLLEVLVQAEVLAGGSMNSFLDSKHFNRCKRIHPLTVAALQILHFEQYLSTTNISSEMLDELLQTQMSNATNESKLDVNERIQLPDLLNRIMKGYKEFCRQTLMGKKGKTAQFFYQYCELINLFQRFSRSIRTSNIELYMDSIFNISDLFFALNQPNYARRSLLYLSNLMKSYSGNSPLIEEFRRGAFGIRRTKANFARSPVDLSLEQTINADASNQLTHNLAAESISARQRWALNHSMRTKILTTIKETLGMTQKDDTSYCLKTNRIKKDKKSLHSIIESIKNTMNPFDNTIDKDFLFNISTGKAAPANVVDFLLNVKAVGGQQKLKFISECSLNSDRFNKPITRNKILNFASQCTTTVLTNKDNKKVLLKMERDIFGRLLAVSIDKKINVEYCLTFPLAAMPPALFSCSGEMFKTDKSKLAKILKSEIEVDQPTNVNVQIIDGFYYLHVIGSSMPQTFEKIAESILIKICSTNATEIHLIFDRYLSPSIKDSERRSRQEFDIPYIISGPKQTRSADFFEKPKKLSIQGGFSEIFS